MTNSPTSMANLQLGKERQNYIFFLLGLPAVFLIPLKLL